MTISNDLLPPILLDKLQLDHAFPELLVRAHWWYMLLSPHFPWVPRFPLSFIPLGCSRSNPRCVNIIGNAKVHSDSLCKGCLVPKGGQMCPSFLLASPFGEGFMLSPQHRQAFCSASALPDSRCLVSSHICFTLLPSLLRSDNVHFFLCWVFFCPVGGRHPR